MMCLFRIVQGRDEHSYFGFGHRDGEELIGDLVTGITGDKETEQTSTRYYLLLNGVRS